MAKGYYEEKKFINRHHKPLKSRPYYVAGAFLGIPLARGLDVRRFIRSPLRVESVSPFANIAPSAPRKGKRIQHRTWLEEDAIHALHTRPTNKLLIGLTQPEIRHKSVLVTLETKRFRAILRKRKRPPMRKGFFYAFVSWLKDREPFCHKKS